MTFVSRIALAAFALLALSFGRAEATLLQMVYTGITAAGSFAPTPGGPVPITVGTPFTVEATFDNVPVSTSPGSGLYDVRNIEFYLDGTLYTVDVAALSDYDLILAGTAAGLPGDTPLLAWTFTNVLAPVYTATVPVLDPQNPSPTRFSGYQGEFNAGNGALTVVTGTGSGVLVFYDQTAGLNAYIKNIPELDASAATGGLALVAAALALAGERRRWAVRTAS